MSLIKYKAYLIAYLKDGKITNIFICGESPWTMTRRSKSEIVLLCKAEGESYTEAKIYLRGDYLRQFPELSQKFPFPGD